jgi:leader peptidase (prepilin peptidase)/N-methyltransferase
MGFGDVKFMAAIGAFLGWKATLFSVFVSSVTGGVVGLVLMALGKKDLQSRIPYGPYIALGALLWILAGHEIVSWYKDLIQLPRG